MSALQRNFGSLQNRDAWVVPNSIITARACPRDKGNAHLHGGLQQPKDNGDPYRREHPTYLSSLCLSGPDFDLKADDDYGPRSSDVLMRFRRRRGHCFKEHSRTSSELSGKHIHASPRDLGGSFQRRQMTDPIDDAEFRVWEGSRVDTSQRLRLLNPILVADNNNRRHVYL